MDPLFVIDMERPTLRIAGRLHSGRSGQAAAGPTPVIVALKLP